MPPSATRRSPGSNAEERTTIVARMASASSIRCMTVCIPQERVGNQDLFDCPIPDGFPDFPDAISNCPVLGYAQQHLVHQLHFPRELDVVHQFLKRTLANNFLDCPAANPPGLDNNGTVDTCTGPVLCKFYKIVLDKPGTGDDQRAGDILDMGEERFEKCCAGIGLCTLAAAGGDGDHALGTVLPEPEEFGLPFLDSQDVDNPVNGCFYGPFHPFKVQRAPLSDNGDLKPGLDIDGMVRPGIHAMFDDPGKAKADAMLGKLHLFDPDAEPDRPFLHLLRPDLVRGCVNAPEGGGKHQIALMR